MTEAQSIQVAAVQAEKDAVSVLEAMALLIALGL